VVSDLHGKFEKATGVIFTDYKGLTVQEISDLRKALRTASIDYKVVKNTLAKKASEGTQVGIAKDNLTGPVGIAFGYDDAVLLAKKVLEFAKTNEKLKVKGGVIEGKACDAAAIKTVSGLPSRNTLLAMFIGAMQSPLNKLGGALSATLTKFTYAMEALKKQKESS
jgi:large subunit ribosomal protein L10